MALYGKGGAFGGMGRRRHSEQGMFVGSAGGQNAMCDDKIATIKF
ncbi:hypothetical protein [uncultured Campylobacter sp.]|nr:hypothetical protein [uncultured Campylobacter sp.]